jgi:hypothetical protein
MDTKNEYLKAMQETQKNIGNLQEAIQPYNMPNAEADFTHWIKEGYWTIDEGIALLLEKNPEKVKWPDIEKRISYSPFAKKFDDIRKRVNRYLQIGHITDPCTPDTFINWAEKTGIEIPQKLLEAHKKFNSTNLQSQHNETIEQLKQNELLLKELTEKHLALEIRYAELKSLENKNSKSVTSLLKLLSAMAFDGYGYRFEDKKSPTPRELSQAVEKILGEKIDEDTVRKWLKYASENYPPKNNPS